MHPFRNLFPWVAVSLLVWIPCSVKAQDATDRVGAPGATETTAHSIPVGETVSPRELDGSSVGLSETTSSSRILVDALEPAALRALANEVLDRDPQIARAERLAAAVAVRAPQVRALPDPVAALKVFVLPVETRVGPQRVSLSIAQKLPWFGKLALRERIALLEAVAAEEEVERLRLERIEKLRRLIYELGFLAAQQDIVDSERVTLVRYERAAQALYAAGGGLQQGIVRIQAQITRTDTRLLELEERRARLASEINALRDRPAQEPIPAIALPAVGLPVPRLGELRQIADASRPVLAAARARISVAKARGELAEKDFRPDLTLGLSFTSVESREDAPGRANPPPDNGDDIVALSGSFNLPIRRQKLEAGLEEAQSLRWAAEEAERSLLAEIESAIGDLETRIPLLVRHLNLLETVLVKQAQEALRSAETAYSTGKLNAVDLLDAEVVLFEVRIATERTRTDLAIAHAQLERAVGQPIEAPSENSSESEPSS